jgi:hypothetical protein
MAQAQRSAGFLGGRVAPEPPLGFWTFTVWADGESMRRFRNTAAHLKAMPRLLDWCDEASYVHWEQENSEVPTPKVAFERLRDAGHLSKVRHPSPAHIAGKTAPYGVPKAGADMEPRKA